jgi:hypothetical protein
MAPLALLGPGTLSSFCAMWTDTPRYETAGDMRRDIKITEKPRHRAGTFEYMPELVLA